MSQVPPTTDSLNFDTDPPKISSTLNVLTILTFIWSSIEILILIALPAITSFMLGLKEKVNSSGEELSAEKIEKMEKLNSLFSLIKVNMIPFMAVGLIGAILCFVGALWMRKLRKDGYWLYIAGELAPIIATFIIMGSALYSTPGDIIMRIAIPILFVILYTTQRKYLVR